MAYCREHLLVKSELERQVAVTLPCNAWTCEECAAHRKAQLIAQGHGGKPNTFLTLTTNQRDWPTPNQAAKALARAWRLLRLRAIREARRDPKKSKTPCGPPPKKGWPLDKHGNVPNQVKLWAGKLPFLCVMEKHENGWPHLHVMLRSYWMAQQWLSQQMLDIIESPIVDIRRIFDQAQVSAYVAKYCGKAAQKFATCKRYWQSRDYDLRPKVEKWSKSADPRSWHREQSTLLAWCQRLLCSGWLVIKNDGLTAEAVPRYRAQGPPQPPRGQK